MGFHFYNPPPVQKLVEVIYPDNSDPSLKTMASELGKALGKVLIESKDVAGFIGNGFFIREIHYAGEQVMRLAKERPLVEAIETVNRVTQDYLLRPMGLFELIDYVGLDIAHRIKGIMQSYLPREDFSCDLIDRMLAAGITGGQRPDGSHKAGFLNYENNIPAGIYSLEKKAYLPLRGGDAGCELLLEKISQRSSKK